MSSFYPLQKIKNREEKIPITQSGIGIYSILSRTESFPFIKNRTTYLTVSAISCKYYFYRWINITYFSCYLLFCFHALMFLQQRNT